MIQYVSLGLDLIFIVYFTVKLRGIENNVENIVEFLHAEKVASDERRNDYESNLNSRLETLQKMRFSPLRVVTKRDQ